MKKESLIPAAIFSVVCLGIATLLSAQTALKSPEATRSAQQEFAVGLLRSINTAEYEYHLRTGSFAAWPVLLQSERRFFGRKFFDSPDYGLSQSPMSDHRLAELHLSAGPEILPGWNIRLNVHADGQGYDVLLKDLSDKNCAYAALTDEDAIIRQSKALDCEL